MLRYSSLVILTAICMASCMPSPYYEKSDSVPDNAWARDYSPTYRFDVTDTTSYYTLYFIIRHTEAYPYANIWLRISTLQPGDSIPETTRIEVPLAAPSGQWLGRGMGAITEHRMMLTGAYDRNILSRPGTYDIKIEQDMRVDPLPEVLHVGLRVEKGITKPSGNTTETEE